MVVGDGIAVLADLEPKGVFHIAVVLHDFHRALFAPDDGTGDRQRDLTNAMSVMVRTSHYSGHVFLKNVDVGYGSCHWSEG